MSLTCYTRVATMWDDGCSWWMILDGVERNSVPVTCWMKPLHPFVRGGWGAYCLQGWKGFWFVLIALKPNFFMQTWWTRRECQQREGAEIFNQWILQTPSVPISKIWLRVDETDEDCHSEWPRGYHLLARVHRKAAGWNSLLGNWLGTYFSQWSNVILLKGAGDNCCESKQISVWGTCHVKRRASGTKSPRSTYQILKRHRGFLGSFGIFAK